MLNTPVLFLIFNRPLETKRVFDAIKKAGPARLFVAADGPRKQVPGEVSRCMETRDVISDKSDFDGVITTLYRDTNLGCARAVSDAINWFFQHTDEGIILEDDCLPDPTFFTFCEELLDKYRNDERIMHISGNNFQLGKTRGSGSYYFSRYPHIWGWATWKRAWNKYDFSMNDYPALRQEPDFKKYLDNRNLMLTYEQQIDTWDSQWVCSIYRNKGFSILPNVNLVQNIGFASSLSTHTAKLPWWLKKMKNGSLPHLVHPGKIEFDNEADLFTSKFIFHSRRQRVMAAMKKLFHINDQ